MVVAFVTFTDIVVVVVVIIVLTFITTTFEGMVVFTSMIAINGIVVDGSLIEVVVCSG